MSIIKNYFGKNWNVTKVLAKEALLELIGGIKADPKKAVMGGFGFLIGGEALFPPITAVYELIAPQTVQEQKGEMPSMKLNLGYNGLENGVNRKGDVRTRAINNFGVSTRGVHVDYNGLNEINDLDKDAYFGRHVVSAGIDKIPVNAGVVVKTVKGGVIDTKVGFRNTTLPEKVVDYGSIDVTVDQGSANATVFAGKVIGNGSVELYNETEIPFSGKPFNFTEIQGNLDITKHLAGFARVEIRHFDMSDTNYIVGITLK